MNAYIFDVDGVLTNPENQEEIRPIIFETLFNLLKQGKPLGFITGRGIKWLREKFIVTMEKYVDKQPALDKSILDLLYVSGEFGAATAEHINGIRQEFLKKEFEIPPDLKKAFLKEVDKLSEYLFVETGKQTIITIRPKFTLTAFESQKYKNEIITSASSLLINYPHIEVQSDRLSVNLRYKKANKKFATDQLILWLNNKGIIPDHYYVFGDSPSDLEMGEELDKQHLPFQFIFVDRKTELNGFTYSFPIIFTKKHCDDGLLEFFSTHHG